VIREISFAVNNAATSVTTAPRSIGRNDPNATRAFGIGPVSITPCNMASFWTWRSMSCIFGSRVIRRFPITSANGAASISNATPDAACAEDTLPTSAFGMRAFTSSRSSSRFPNAIILSRPAERSMTVIDPVSPSSNTANGRICNWLPVSAC
jgi:hypothetical protein